MYRDSAQLYELTRAIFVNLVNEWFRKFLWIIEIYMNPWIRSAIFMNSHAWFVQSMKSHAYFSDFTKSHAISCNQWDKLAIYYLVVLDKFVNALSNESVVLLYKWTFPCANKRKNFLVADSITASLFRGRVSDDVSAFSRGVPRLK